jgi:hypothetical protein
LRYLGPKGPLAKHARRVGRDSPFRRENSHEYVSKFNDTEAEIGSGIRTRTRTRMHELSTRNMRLITTRMALPRGYSGRMEDEDDYTTLEVRSKNLGRTVLIVLNCGRQPVVGTAGFEFEREVR